MWSCLLAMCAREEDINEAYKVLFDLRRTYDGTDEQDQTNKSTHKTQ